MRYTTIIDITDDPAIWRNLNACRLYTYMALRAGYHAEDRDYFTGSYSAMMAATGLTMSALRHALRVLQDRRLITRDGERWLVKKWAYEDFPGPREKPRKKTQAELREEAAANERRLQEEKRHREWQQTVRDACSSSTIEELEQWLEKLRNTREKGRCCFKGAVLWNMPVYVNWLSNYINKRRELS